MNITLQDCIGLSGLDAAEVAALAEHEHIPEIAAAALAQYLMHEPGGPHRIRAMIVDDRAGATSPMRGLSSWRCGIFWPTMPRSSAATRPAGRRRDRGRPTGEDLP